jgi:hypothetical protein
LAYEVTKHHPHVGSLLCGFRNWHRTKERLDRFLSLAEDLKWLNFRKLPLEGSVLSEYHRVFGPAHSQSPPCLFVRSISDAVAGLLGNFKPSALSYRPEKVYFGNGATGRGNTSIETIAGKLTVRLSLLALCRGGSRVLTLDDRMCCK